MGKQRIAYEADGFGRKHTRKSSAVYRFAVVDIVEHKQTYVNIGNVYRVDRSADWFATRAEAEAGYGRRLDFCQRGASATPPHIGKYEIKIVEARTVEDKPKAYKKPRAACPVCGREVVVSKAGKVAKHKEHDWLDDTCIGSNLEPLAGGE